MLMVTGNAPATPIPFLQCPLPHPDLTGTLGIEIGGGPDRGQPYSALFGIAVVLLVITLAINLLATILLAQIKRSTWE